MIGEGTITVFVFVFMRMSGCVLFNPIIGRRNLPNTLKVGLSLMLTFVIMGFAPPEVPAIGSLIEFIVILLKELAVGYIIGFVVTLFSFVIAFGGEIIDMQMGLSMSKIYDPQSNVAMSLTATFYNILFMFLFFEIGRAHV